MSGKKNCPICGKPAAVKTAPFCSARCADIDLHRWLGEAYRVPVKNDDEDEDGTGALPESTPPAH